MTLREFISKWRKAELTERSASQQHFLDLCDVFEHPKPAENGIRTVRYPRLVPKDEECANELTI